MTAPFDPQQYERLSSGTVPGYEELQDLVALAATAAAPASSSSVLDLGCGTGAGTAALARRLPDAQLIACDPSAAMVAAARARCEATGVRAHFVAGGLAAVPDDARFDVVVCTLVLHFIPPDERVMFLSSIRERMRPGGALILSALGRSTDPAVQAVWTQIRRHHATSRGITSGELAAREAETKGKVHPLLPEEVHAALDSAGFSDAVPLYQLLAIHSWLARRSDQPVPPRREPQLQS